MSAETFTIMVYVALIPPIFLMWLVYKQDLVESEPVGLVLEMFLLGCVVPVIVMLIDTPLSILVSFFGTGLLFELAENFIQVALAEEGGKMLMLRLRIWNHKEFNYRFDAIVYSVAVSIGFAAIENLMYVFNFGLETGLSRAITAIPAHAIFAVFMGYYMGEAKYCTVLKKTKLAKRNKIKSILVPVFLHGTYDFICNRPEEYFTLIFWLFIFTTEILAIVKVYKASRGDTELIAPENKPNRTKFNEIDLLLEEIRRQTQEEIDRTKESDM